MDRTLIAAILLSALFGCAGEEEAGPPDEASPPIRHLIDLLGASSVEVRDSAQEELIKLGKAAIPELKKALESHDPEVRSRVVRILARLKPPKEKPIDTDDLGITAHDTGVIMFICVDDSHEDMEVLISACPNCGGRDFFFQDPRGRGFFCFKCRLRVPPAKIVCPACGKDPRSPIRLKRR
jgi:hypothetical protein